MGEVTGSVGRERVTEALHDRYRIERELGSGGMATVYLADDLRHPRKVAIKVLREELSASIGAARFVQEIEIAARLQHPHILPLLDSGDAGGLLFYVMPYVEGQSLRDRLARDGALSAADTSRILVSVVDALAYAHAKGVVHRDIKPDNIMLAGRHALVADFGVAKAVSDAVDHKVVTTMGLALGTPTYMAPEQVSADPGVDHRADIYAVGVMAYEMIAGRPPFVFERLQQVLAAHVTEAPEPLSKYAPQVSPDLERVIMRCLEKMPGDRYQTADELLADIEINSVNSGGSQFRPTVPIVARPSRRIAGWIIGGVVVATGAAYLVRTVGRAPAIIVGNTTQVTNDPGLEIEPAISPDGRSVAYAAGSLGYLHILVRAVDGGRATPLTSDTSTSEWAPRWSHDGSRILFLNARGVFSAPALGGPSRQEVAAAAGAPITWAGWSRDGRRLAYVRGDSLLVRAGGSPTDRLITHSGDLHSCDWSPNDAWLGCVSGNSVAVTAGRRIGNVAPSRIVLIAVRDGTRAALPDSGGFDSSPVWHPDGRRLLFLSNRAGKWDVYAQRVSSGGFAAAPAERVTTGLGAQAVSISADGARLVYAAYEARANAWAMPIPRGGPVSANTAVKLTTATQYMEAVAVSASGKWITYDSNVRGTANLYRQSLRGGDAEAMTSDSSRQFRGALSPDDKELAFMSWRTGTRDIFVLPLDGGPLQQVTSSDEQETFPVWSPDGRALAYFTVNRLEAYVVKRDASGAWGKPVKRVRGSIVQWSPDGQSLCYEEDSTGGVGVIGAYTGAPRIVYRPAPGSRDPVAESPLFSRDGTTLYFKSHDIRGKASIWSVPVAGGRPKLLVRFDDPARQSNWPEISSDGERFYFTIDESQSDVYAVSLGKR